MKVKNIQITIIVFGTILVSIPFITKMVEEYNYRSQLTKIKEYVTKISDSKKQCTIQFKNNLVQSDCADKLELSNHIIMNELRLHYENGVFQGEEILLINSIKFPEQYCMGFSGLIIASGYYDRQCNNFQNP